MIKFIFIEIVLISLFSVYLLAQSTYTVEVTQSGFDISVGEFNPVYRDIISGGITIRDYKEFTDPSEPGSYKLPNQNIYLAIPKNSIVEIVNLEYKSIFIEKVIPALNPHVRLKDSSLVYDDAKYSESKSRIGSKTVVSVESYFWFREFYLVHLKINSTRFIPESTKLEILSGIKFSVKILPSTNLENYSPLQNHTDYDRALSTLISNSEYAEQFRNQTSVLLDDTTGNWINYGATYVKIGTIEDAVHRITSNDLEVLGINTNVIDPRTFQIYESGRELNIFVFGENDGVFDQNDFIEFWGHKNYPSISYRIINDDDQEYNEYLNRYSDTSYFFLTWNVDIGMRADSISLSPSGITDTVNYFSKLLHFENNPFFDFNNNNEVANQTPDWNKNKSWYRHTLTSQRTYNVALDEIFPNRDAVINAKAVGWASSIPTNSHQVKLILNNSLLDSNSIDRFKQLLLSGQINSSSLINGTNQIKLENIPNGSDPNGLLVDWFEIEYPRNLKMISDSILFKIADDFTSGLNVLKILNANASDFRIYKVYPEFKIVSNYSIGSNSLIFADTVHPGDKYYVMDDAKRFSPAFYRLINFRNLRNITDQTDYIAITHKDFLPAVINYAQSISDQFSITSKEFSTEEIFDEFSFGYPYPEGIRLFLNVFYNNASVPKPQYLNLIGDSNYDYKNFSGSSVSKNYVTSFGNPVGDNWFTVWDQNGPPIPQFKVGRIPIIDTEQLAHYRLKIENNNSSEFNEWNKRYLFFSGGMEEYEYQLLKSVNDTIISRFINPRPIGGFHTHFYKTVEPPTDFGPYTPDQFQTAIQKGGLFISYIGHSGTATWDNSINETNQLLNTVNRHPLITDFGCSTNKYAEPQITCFGERFLFNETGQAISYVGNSSLGFQSTAVTSPIYFYEKIVTDSISEIGNAHLYSKVKLFSELGNTGVNRIFALSNLILGDPSVRIKIPKKPNFRILSSDINIEHDLLNDNLDSVEVKIVIKNLGIADTSIVQVKLKQMLGTTEIRNEFFNILSPLFADTLSFWILIKDRPGNHTLEVDLDPDNSIDEIYEDDNFATTQIYVASGSLRDLLTAVIENPTIPNLKILNPSIFDEDEFGIEIQVSSDNNFINPTSILVDSDTVVSNVEFPQMPINSRNYFRYRINQVGELFSGVKSFYNSDSSNFLLVDSLSFDQQQLQNLSWVNDSIRIVPDSINISVLSAGYYTGATCVIAKDGINLLSNTFFAGMGIVVFDGLTLEVDTSAWFKLYGDPANVETLANLIDSIPAGKIVAMGVADDAANDMSQHLKDAIKTLGSSKIDSLQFRGSWAIIGWKGAPAGSVLEKVRSALPPQSVFIDTTYIVQSVSGSLQTSNIGPANDWKTISVIEKIPDDAFSQYYVSGVKANGQIDSIRIITFENGVANIIDIDAITYPYIFLKGDLHVSSENISPTISKISVEFWELPELATNYQVVSISKDTLLIGEDVDLKFRVYNVGETKAGSFNVKVEVVNENNSRQTIFSERIDSLHYNEFKLIEVMHNTSSGSGSKSFLITIDSSNEVRELFEDNNFFSIPFYVQPDTTTPTLTLTFDGYDILDGDFISPEPEIHIELFDQSLLPITDPSSVLVYMNDNLIPSDTSIITYTFSPENPKVTVDYSPSLSDGDYNLKILWKDVEGNIVDSSGIEKYFQVSSDAQLLYVFNYPNPTSGETNFTFKLTQIPDNIQIKIYTIAGRLIKNIELSSSELRFDFNKIYWDGNDEDGDPIGNGVYLYKVIMQAGDISQAITQKLAIVK